MDNILIMAILLFVVICMFVVVLVWNIRLLARTMQTTDAYTTLVLQSYTDVWESDAHEDPVLAALRTQAAIIRLETAKTFAGGENVLSQITRFDIANLQKLLHMQFHDIQSFLPANAATIKQQ